jgi:hypothetical protein
MGASCCPLPPFYHAADHFHVIAEVSAFADTNEIHGERHSRLQDCVEEISGVLLPY